MLNDLLFSRTVTPDLEKSMDAYALRQKVISNNVANAMTPGYRAQKVNFEEDYKKTLYPDPNPTLKLTQTHDGHMQVGPKPTFSMVHPQVDYRDNPVNDTGLNNVDIDREMAEMAVNNLRYEMSTRVMTKKFTTMKSAIRGR